VVVLGAIAPHGTIAVPEACADSERHLAAATQRAMEELGRRFDQSRPDATVIFTPHSVHVSDHLAVVAAARIEGSLASWDAGLDHVRLSVRTHTELAAEVLAEARRSLPVLAVSYGGNDPVAAVMPMDWATLIPLWFMGGRREPSVPVVVAIPCRELDAAAHIAFGAAIARAAERSGLRIAVIASADHGHGHRADGPYGFTPASRAYDDKVLDIVGRGALSELAMLEREFVDEAKADSWWQLLMLHGALEEGGAGWRAEVLSYEAPTYFGMLCASFTAS
jgi:aromatic ring-opening dioxygenase LigB subunit